MGIGHNNFGIMGQQKENWDTFLCIGRKCRERKEERHDVRMEKRKLKNDQQRAETEALRSDTLLTKQLASPVQNIMETTTENTSSTSGHLESQPQQYSSLPFGIRKKALVIAGAALVVLAIIGTIRK